MRSEWTKSVRTCADESWTYAIEIPSAAIGNKVNLRAVIARYGDKFSFDCRIANQALAAGQPFLSGVSTSFDAAEVKVADSLEWLRDNIDAAPRLFDGWTLDAESPSGADRLWRRKINAQAGDDEREISLLIIERDAQFFPVVDERRQGEGISLPPHKSFTDADRTLRMAVSSAAKAVEPFLRETPSACAYCGAWSLDGCVGYTACISRITPDTAITQTPPYTHMDAMEESYRALREWEGEDIDELVAAAHWRPDTCGDCGFIVCSVRCPRATERNRVAAMGELNRALAKAALSAKDALRQLAAPETPDETAAVATAEAYLKWRGSV